MKAIDVTSAKGPQVLAVIVGTLFMAALPFFVTAFWLNVFLTVAVLGIYAMSYDLLLGRAGLFSFGHALFLGSSAYVVAYLTTRQAMPLLLSLVLGVLAAAVLAGIVGVVLSKVRGIYFGMLTLAIAQMGYSLADRDVGGVTGGENGMAVSQIPEAMNANLNPVTLYWTILVVFAVTLVVLALIRRSAAGQLWLAIRENEVRAEALGIDVRRQRWLVFTIAGAFAGLAGALYAVSVQTVTPNVLAIAMTVQALLSVVIGGLGTFWGPLLGAAFVGVLPPVLDELSSTSVITGLPPTMERAVTSYFLVLGLCYVLFVLFLPGGFMSAFQRVMHRGKRRRGRDRGHDGGDRATDADLSERAMEPTP
jgi:branched-chain amino acid transport system permease protein